MFDKYSHIVSFQQNKSRSKKYAGKKDIIALVITSGNSAKPLEFLQETFDHMAIFVNMPVAEPRSDCIAFGRNRVLTVNTLNVVENLICSVCFVGKNIAVSQIKARQKIYCHCGIMDVSRSK